MRKMTANFSGVLKEQEAPEVPYLALYKGSEQDKNRDPGSDNKVDEVPEGQAAHLPQSHLLHLQAQPIPLVPQRALEANQHHLQSCGGRRMRRGRQSKAIKCSPLFYCT